MVMVYAIVKFVVMVYINCKFVVMLYTSLAYGNGVCYCMYEFWVGK